MRTLLSLTSSPIDRSCFSLKRSTAALKALDGLRGDRRSESYTQAEGHAPDFRGRVAMALTKHGGRGIIGPREVQASFRRALGLGHQGGLRTQGLAVTCGSLVASTGLEVRSHPRDKLSWRLPAEGSAARTQDPSGEPRSGTSRVDTWILLPGRPRAGGERFAAPGVLNLRGT